MNLLESHIVFIHLLIRWPIMLTRRASTVEPVLLLKLNLSFVFGHSREDWPVVLRDFLAFLDVLYSSHNNVCSYEIPVNVTLSFIVE